MRRSSRNDEWRRYSVTLGRMVKVIAPDTTYTGKAEDIDEEGALLVRRENGHVERVLAGDVSIRPAQESASINKRLTMIGKASARKAPLCLYFCQGTESLLAKFLIFGIM